MYSSKSAWFASSSELQSISRPLLLLKPLMMWLSYALCILSLIVRPQVVHLLLDQWRGGYIFLYWAVEEGPKWLRNIVKDGISVSLGCQKY
jgi:hypothetical protein